MTNLCSIELPIFASIFFREIEYFPHLNGIKELKEEVERSPQQVIVVVKTMLKAPGI